MLIGTDEKIIICSVLYSQLVGVQAPNVWIELNKVQNLPNFCIDGVDERINRCFRFIAYFLDQKNVIALHDLRKQYVQCGKIIELLYDKKLIAHSLGTFL